jgi:hypothetical protein
MSDELNKLSARRRQTWTTPNWHCSSGDHALGLPSSATRTRSARTA